MLAIILDVVTEAIATGILLRSLRTIKYEQPQIFVMTRQEEVGLEMRAIRHKYKVCSKSCCALF